MWEPWSCHIAPNKALCVRLDTVYFTENWKFITGNIIAKYFLLLHICLPVFSTWLVYEQCREPAKKHNLYKCKRKRNQLYTNAPFVVFIIEYMLCMCKCFIYLFLKSYLYSYNWHFYFACSCASSKVAYWDVPRSLCLSFDY